MGVVVVVVWRAGVEEEVHPAAPGSFPPGRHDDEGDGLGGGAPPFFTFPSSSSLCFSDTLCSDSLDGLPSPFPLVDLKVEDLNAKEDGSAADVLPGRLAASERLAPEVVGEVMVPEWDEGSDENKCCG